MDSPAAKLWKQFIDPSDFDSESEFKICRAAIYDVLYSPFVVALVSGNLQLESFKRHVAGALQILGAIAELYERIAERKTLSEKAKAAISELRVGIIEEQFSILELKDLKIDVSIESPSSEAARKYCSFIKAAASRHEDDPAYLLATVVPFVRLTVYSAHQLKEAADARYLFWIKRNCLSSPLLTETVFNSVCEENAKLRDDELKGRYNLGMLFVIDFLSTPVSIDECSIVPLIRELDASRDNILLFCGFESSCCYYTQEMLAQMHHVLPIVKVGFVHNNVHNVLNKLAGLFSGFQVDPETHKDIDHIYASQGFRDLIEAADTNKMLVNAHLMSSISSDICTVHKSLGSSSLKVEIFREVQKANKKKVLTIYIGGGVDDLECILEADIGITFDPCSELVYICDQLGVSLVMLWDTILDKQKQMRKGIHSLWKSKSGTVYVVRSWNEVLALVFGALNENYTPKITSEERITRTLPKAGRQSGVFRLLNPNRYDSISKSPPDTATELQNPVPPSTTKKIRKLVLPEPKNKNPDIAFSIGDKRELKKKPPETTENQLAVIDFLKNLPKPKYTNQTIDIAEEQDASKKVERKDKKQAVEQDVSKAVEEEDRKQAKEEDLQNIITHSLPKAGRQSGVFRLLDTMGYENRYDSISKSPPDTETELQNPMPPSTAKKIRKLVLPEPKNKNPDIAFSIGDKRELKKKPPETKTLPDDLQTSVSAPPTKEKKLPVDRFLKFIPKRKYTNQTIDIAEEQDASKKVERKDRKQAVEQDVSKTVEEEDRKQAKEEDLQKVEEEDLKHGCEQVDKEEDEPAGDI